MFVQKTTHTRIQGKRNVTKTCQAWNDSFEQCQAFITRVSTISEHKFVVQWNVTWIPPSAAWLELVGESFFTTEYVTYNHLANQVSTFSWNAVYKFFARAVTTGKLRIPTACIEGTSSCRVDSSGNLIRVEEEDLSYVMDLSRGTLQNRKCADDLDYFLQVARRPRDYSEEEWESHVRNVLVWSTVPGYTDPLYVEQNREDSVGIVYFGIVMAVLLVFANTVGPMLIGQSLIGPPSYIVAPNDLQFVL